MPLLRRCLRVAASVGAVSLMLVAESSAATITVSTTDNTVAVDGKCSLREAISNANTDTGPSAAPGECPAGSGADTISLPAGTYAVPGAALSISDDLTIAGASAATTSIEQDGTERVFLIQPAGDPVVTFRGLTITGGRAPYGMGPEDAFGAAGQDVIGGDGTDGANGGGIYNAGHGRLTIDATTITANVAGWGGRGAAAHGGDGAAGAPGGTGTGGRGGDGGSGGGIYSLGAVTLRDCRVSGQRGRLRR